MKETQKLQDLIDSAYADDCMLIGYAQALSDLIEDVTHCVNKQDFSSVPKDKAFLAAYGLFNRKEALNALIAGIRERAKSISETLD
ncbi:hypothetical protein [Limosilactobacillus sp.]|uniref:hypothetical protein n=1 Tax=Limosilactobacillus sp. TaxID=2773925 RepID=UPI00345E3B43